MHPTQAAIASSKRLAVLFPLMCYVLQQVLGMPQWFFTPHCCSTFWSAIRLICIQIGQASFHPFTAVIRFVLSFFFLIRPYCFVLCCLFVLMRTSYLIRLLLSCSREYQSMSSVLYCSHRNHTSNLWISRANAHIALQVSASTVFMWRSIHFHSSDSNITGDHDSEGINYLEQYMYRGPTHLFSLPVE